MSFHQAKSKHISVPEYVCFFFISSFFFLIYSNSPDSATAILEQPGMRETLRAQLQAPQALLGNQHSVTLVGTAQLSTLTSLAPCLPLPTQPFPYFVPLQRVPLSCALGLGGVSARRERETELSQAELSQAELS